MRTCSCRRPTGSRRIGGWLILCAIAVACGNLPRSAFAQDSASPSSSGARTPGAPASAASTSGAADAVSAVLEPAFYGVPASPAFELLPDKPTNVTHVLTPKDFQSTLSTWYDGTKLRAGVAFDARPFIESAGDLTAYRANWLRRLALRTVLSAGTAKAVTGDNDVVTALGLRIPLVDFADPRMAARLDTLLIQAYDSVLRANPPTSPFPSADETAQREKLATGALDPIRRAYEDSTWNSAQLELGFAGSTLVRSAAPSADSLESQRGGAWIGGAMPAPAFGTRGQLTGSLQSAWVRAVSDTSETNRTVAGGRAILFATRRFSASAEAAEIWSRHRRQANLNERWTHFGVLVEWAVPALKGWLGASYGGDSGRRDKRGDSVGLRYAFYPTPAITR